MTVQDDERERELCRTFNLKWDPSHARGGEDASMVISVAGQKIRLAVEVKSTTGDTVSTARDVSMEHIRRWRAMFFVIGFYTRHAKRPELIRSLFLTPVDMAPWIDTIAVKIEPDYKLAQLASRRLELSDLHEVCGMQAAYTLEAARRLHKQQWSSEQYRSAIDIPGPGGGLLSPGRMLEVLQLRSQYIAERGATLNNPHITKTFLNSFWGTDREVQADESAEAVRKLAADFLAAHPDHPAGVKISN